MSGLTKLPGRRLLGALLAVLLLPSAAGAGAMNWEKFADDPDSYIGKPVQVLGYCAQDDADGYQCSTEGDLYIVAADIKPEFAKKKIEENCGGMDVIERSSFCRAMISFTPKSVSTSTTLEPGKTVTVISADIAMLKF